MSQPTSKPFSCVPPSPADQAEQSRWFKAEVHPHEPALRAWLQRQYPTLSEVDDVVQESYLKLLSARERGSISSAKAYLFAIARNAALSFFRKRHHISIETAQDLEFANGGGASGDVVEAVSARQEFMLATEAIDALPARCREIVILRVVHGLPHKEIGRRLGLAEQTVRVQVARGMKKCADFLRERGVDGKGRDATC